MAEESEIYEHEEVQESKEEVPYPTKGSSGLVNTKNYYILGVLLVLFIALFFLFFSNPTSETVVYTDTLPMCGDGTFYSDCSLNRPYYCDGGELVYDTVLCGCPDVLTKIDGSCTNSHFQEGRLLTLQYVLDGEVGEIPFTAYEGVSDYLDTRERTITYAKGEIPRRSDFKLNKIDDELQREALMDLLVQIQNAAPDSAADQVRIATSLVQHIPYKESEFGSVGNFKTSTIRLARYPYQVVERLEGSCEGKSELLVFLLREMGYGTAVFYYNEENHEAVGVRCPVERSVAGSGYCFIETTVAAPISYSSGNYLIGESQGESLGTPEVVVLSQGKALPDNLYEYRDVAKIDRIFENGRTDALERVQLGPIYERYGMSVE